MSNIYYRDVLKTSITILKRIVLKSKRPRILLNENITFNKNETESKIENPTHSFREANLQLIQESQIKSKTAISWSSRKKKEDILVSFILFEGRFF